MAEQVTVRAEDVLPVRSRVSWAAIFGGAVVGLACYLLLSMFGAAVGLSVADRARPSTIGTGASIWAIFSLVLSLFVGGMVTTQLAVGENKFEAIVHGVIMWGVFFAALLWMVNLGIRSGFNALVGAAAITQATGESWEEAARRAGVSPEQINEWRRKAGETTEEGRRAATDPQEQQQAVETARWAAWLTLIGTALSMGSAILGAWAGAGPTIRLLTVRMRGGPHGPRPLTTPGV